MTPNSHTPLAITQLAVRRRWAISDEVKDELIVEMRELLRTGSPRDRTRAAEILAGLERMNQTDELAAEYAIPGGVEGTCRILSPAETAALMDGSIPVGQESTTEPEEKAWPSTPIPAASPSVLLLPDAMGLGLDTSAPAV